LRWRSVFQVGLGVLPRPVELSPTCQIGDSQAPKKISLLRDAPFSRQAECDEGVTIVVSSRAHAELSAIVSDAEHTVRAV